VSVDGDDFTNINYDFSSYIKIVILLITRLGIFVIFYDITDPEMLGF
jgi:hypothetical protein